MSRDRDVFRGADRFGDSHLDFVSRMMTEQQARELESSIIAGAFGLQDGLLRDRKIAAALLEDELSRTRKAAAIIANDAIMFAADLTSAEAALATVGVKCHGSVSDGVREVIGKFTKTANATASSLRTLEAKVKTLENFVDRSDLRRNGEHVIDAALRLLCMARDKSSVFDYERTIKTYRDSANTSEKHAAQLKEEMTREVSSRDGTIAALRIKLGAAEEAASKHKATERRPPPMPCYVSRYEYEAQVQRSSAALNAEIQAKRDVTRERDKLAADFKAYKVTAEKTSSDCEKTINDLRRQVRLIGLSKTITITMHEQTIRFEGWRLPATDDLFVPLMQRCVGLRTDEAMDKAKHGTLEILRGLHRDLVLNVNTDRDVSTLHQVVYVQIDMDLVSGLLAGVRR